ncbi:MAG: tetratricopeptide repeat protein [Clostridia bacterium]|nr:tetratricopeptide repeat protein [Clostridia bacterium]
MKNGERRPVTAEDYEEPACLLMTGKCSLPRVPTGRIVEKLDSLLDAEDYAGAERHLKYWLREAETVGDPLGESTVSSELAGLYRRSGRVGEAEEYAGLALDAARRAGMEGTVFYATANLNAGTVFRAAGKYERSIEYFDAALPVYASLPDSDSRKAGLFNNRALTLASLGRCAEAESSFRDALRCLESVPGSEGERAVTYLNLADLYEKLDGPEDASGRIAECLDLAEAELAEGGAGTGGNAAFVLEKCAPVFAYYGRIAAERDCRKRAAEIRKKLKQ